MGGSAAPQTGRTAAGLFTVPRTADMFVTLSSPSRWGPAELLTWVIMICHASLLLWTNVLPLPIYIAAFAFWRMMYNFGLGVILTAQSRNKSVTRWLDDAPRGTKDLVKWLVTASLGPDYKWSKVPLEFNAWIAFRAVAMVVLANDGLAYLVLTVACFKPISESSNMALVSCAIVGTALNVFSVWSKAAAHDCVGDFAWYWGDFFFLMEGELTFSGVFELFPHPMYTVGYSAYYGISLICRSYTLLFVSLLAHAAQIAFLIFVEEPHIQKIYGGGDCDDADVSGTEGVKQPPSAGARGESTQITCPAMVGFGWPSLFSVGDVALYSCVAATLATLALGRPSSASTVFFLLVLRLVHWGGLGSILRWQATENWFMRRAQEEGVSEREALGCWKQLWNISWGLNHAAFVFVAVYVAPNPYKSVSSVISPVSISHILGGLALICVALGTGYSAFETLNGDYGFFYSNFFEPEPADAEKPPVASYKGIYRYVNNPECVLGSLAYYGVAIILKSWLVFIIAFLCQAAHALFIIFVEMPHLARTHRGVRDRAALERTIRKHVSVVADAVPVVGAIRDQAQLTAVRSKNMLNEKQKVVADATTLIMGRKEQLVSDIGSLNSRLCEHKLYLRAVEFKEEASTKFKTFDGESIVCALERRGIAIERVNDVSGGRNQSGLSGTVTSADARRVGCDVGSTTSEAQ